MNDDISWPTVALALITALPGIIAAIKAAQAKNEAAKAHVAVNSRVDELLRVVGEAQRAQGVLEGRAAEKEAGGGG